VSAPGIVKIGVTAALVWVAAPAQAQPATALAPGSATVSASPGQAGAGATYALGVLASEPRGAYPAGLLISLPAGSRLDGRSAPKRCSRKAALRLGCPRASRIGVGSAQLLQTATFSPIDTGVPLTVGIGVYAAPTKRPGRLGGLQVITREGVTAIGGKAGGIVMPAGPGGGPALSMGLGLVQRAPEETITFTSLSLSLGAHHGRHVLIRNPPSCGGSWQVDLTLSGVEPLSASAPCSPT
jgi:hypothetical protein